MKYLLPQLKVHEQLIEFNSWITSKLSEIKDSDKFKEELNNISAIIEILGLTNNSFKNPDLVSLTLITQAILDYIKDKRKSEKTRTLMGFFSFLFLVTGKSNNNCKCQFPVFLKQNLNKTTIPALNSRNNSIVEVSIPNILSDTNICKMVVDLSAFPVAQFELLFEYVEFILDEPDYIKSLWSLCRAYFEMKSFGTQYNLLMPIVVYRVRGSVSASGGHEPEEILREYMKEWGLFENQDFNVNDVIVGDIGSKNKKTRAYDFVLPYKLDTWSQRIFIQSQFYAGDSGSVSHKNVDQTRTSREWVKSIIEDPIFLEYVDGAGYAGSLNGDLKKILAMEDTTDFIQVRTAPVRLRFYFQQIGFLTPLELVHALSNSDLNTKIATDLLLNENYSQAEINRLFEILKEKKLILPDDLNTLKVKVDNQFWSTSRLYFLLDLIILNGKEITQKGQPVILVPGFARDYGLTLKELAIELEQKQTESLFAIELSKSTNLMSDLNVLVERRWVKNKEIL